MTLAYRIMSTDDHTYWADADTVDIDGPLVWSVNNGSPNPYVTEYVSLAIALGDESLREHPDAQVEQAAMVAARALDALAEHLTRHNEKGTA